MVSTVTGRPVQDEVVDPSYWVRHIRETVRFAAGMTAVRAEGCDVFLEVGPRPTLLAMGRQSVAEPGTAWLPSLRPNRGDWSQMLESLATLYVRGADVDWSGFDRGYRRRKVVLPSYPFERQTYPLPRSGRSTPGRTAVAHPLAETLVQSPLVRETILSTALSTAAFPYLADHRLFGEVVAPAGCYLAMMLNGARRLGQSACRMEDVFFVAPLILTRGEERTLQSVIDPEGAFRIISYRSADSPEEMIDHVRGRLASSSEVGPAAATLADARARCRTAVDHEQLAAGIEGIDFGPSFRWIDSLWTGDRDALTRLRVPEAVGSTEGYWLHPGLLDACLQTAGMTLQAEAIGAARLPFHVNRLEVLAPAPGATWWCHASQVGEDAWDVRLFDEGGNTIAVLNGFEMRQAGGGSFHRHRAADWVYRVEWQRTPRPEPKAPARAQTWLIVDHGSGLGGELSDRAAGRSHRPVLAASGEEVRRALEESPDHVVFLCGSGGGADVPSQAEAAATRSLDLIQAIGRAGVAPRLWLVTLGSQAALASDLVRLVPAPIWGLGRTLQLESPALKCVCVDLPAEPTPQDLDALVGEIGSPSAETQVAYRWGERFAARLVRQPDEGARPIDGPFRLQLTEYGSAEHLRLVPMTRRPPGPGEVEIEVKAAGLNFRDVLIVLGMLRQHYSRALNIERASDVPLGFDCAGIITAVGEGVSDLKEGDEVMSFASGSFASYLTAPATDVVPKPAGMSFEAAAAIPTVFATAHVCLLQIARLKPGERVLIHAAAGGVGQAAVQLARLVGAEVFATASPGKWDLLRAQGVAHVMNSRSLEFAGEVLRLTGGEGVDVVLNSLSGEAIERSLGALKEGGRFVEIGKLGIWPPEQVAERRPDVLYHVFELMQSTDGDPELPRRTLNPVREWFEAGRLRPLPLRLYPAREAAEAFRALQEARQVGKVVLSLSPETGPAVQGDGCYLITGGLGGLGLKVAGLLVERGARRLVLAGRSDPSATALEAVERLRSAGATVHVVTADVAHAADVARLVGHCQSLGKLRGIVHAAGVLDDGILDRQTPERFARVMAPKVHGAWHLHTHTRDLPLDFFVGFSSMASALGSRGQGNYAAANAFLDGLAHHRRALGLAGLSIGWGPWAEVGMAAGLPLAGQGVEKLEVDDGLHVLHDLLQPARRSGPAHLGVWRVHWPAFQRQLPAGDLPPWLGALVRKSRDAGAGALGSDDFLRRYRATEADGRGALLEATIQDMLAKVLGLPSGQEVSPTRPWAEVGLDSLMMVDLKNRLEALLRVTLPVEKLVREITSRDLAAFLTQKLNDAAPGDDPGPGDLPAASASREVVLSEQALRDLVLQIPQMFVTAEKQRGRRILADGRWRLDFASCNYLGLDFHPEVIAAIPPALAEWGVHPSWTRAVASPKPYDDLERELAAFVGAPTTLVFPSISLLHLGVLPTLAGYDGVILIDAEAHHTMHEACLRAQANGAEWVNFRHGDLDDLVRKLTRHRPGRTKIIATDGVYSMGSSHPPLPEYARLAKEHNATLYVDDAHGFGVIGEEPDDDLPYGHRGNGMARHFGLDYVADRLVYVAGLSKAFSSYAAFVTCVDESIKWTLQGSGPFVFSGPTCVASLASALAGLRVNAREGDSRRRLIYGLTRRFVTALRDLGFEVDNGGFFPIVGVVIGGVEDLVKTCRRLWEHDILITPAMYPAVPLDRNLVRFSITAANTEDQVERAIAALKDVRDSLDRVADGVESAAAASKPVIVS
jgi:myxalamid-type polyketide synthase MxaB